MGILEADRQRKRSPLPPNVSVRAFGGLMAVYLGCIGAAYVGSNRDLPLNYDKQFTWPGKCLEGTSYDDSHDGAEVTPVIKSDELVLEVTPDTKGIVHDDPSLYLTVQRHGILKPTFAAADHITLEFLREAGCPDQPSGQ